MIVGGLVSCGLVVISFNPFRKSVDTSHVPSRVCHPESIWNFSLLFFSTALFFLFFILQSISNALN